MDSFEHINLVPQPRNLKISLFPHQLASIYNMETLEREKRIVRENYYQETSIGINADITGFGKTLSMVGLLARDRMEWSLDEPYVFENIYSEAAGRMKKHTIKRMDKLPATLVVVNQSILHQWMGELKQTDLKTFAVTTKKEVEKVVPEELDVVVVTSSMYNKLVGIHPNKAWKRFIVDEPGHMRIAGMKEIHAGFIWLVTATPNAITTKHRNCRDNFIKNILGNNTWCMLQEQFSDIIIKNEISFIEASFRMPPTHHHYHYCYNPMYNVVKDFVSPGVNNMIEAGNIEGAITLLGGEKTSNIVELVNRKKMEELEEIESKIRIYTIRGDQERVREWEDKKLHINNQIQELEKRFQDVLQSQCNICLDNLVEPILEPNCQTVFCGRCLFSWLKRDKRCPICRHDIEPNGLVYIKTGNEEEKQEIHCNIQHENRCTKQEKIVEIIKNNKGGKFLIFSSFDNTFFPICSTLTENNISYAIIKGNIHNRINKLEAFKRGDISVIFLNSNFDGSGINLQEATDIILYHIMTENTEKQILGRANRIGRQYPLNVHHLQIQN